LDELFFDLKRWAGIEVVGMMAASVGTMVLLGAGLVVFWMEPPGVLGVLERLAPNFIYRVRTAYLWWI
jgi:hypothetical protein